MLKACNIFLVLVLITGCRTAKQLIDKAEKRDAISVAQYTRDKYPCTIVKSDTATIYQDSIFYIDCPEASTQYEVIVTDTIHHTKTIRVPVSIPVKIISKWFEDSAKLKIAAVTIYRQTKQIETLTTTNKKLTEKTERRGKENWIWRLIAFCLICWQCFKLIKWLKFI